MKTKTTKLISLFFTLIIIIFLIIPIIVFGADAEGNHLYIEDIYQNGMLTDTFNNITYSENMNITIKYYLWDNFQFITSTMVNTTVINSTGNSYVNSYQGIGIQIYDEDLNSIYANGLTPTPYRLYDPKPFEVISYITENIELDLYKTINYVNVTLWHNYEATGDVEDFELTESWKFNLIAENYGEEEEEDMLFTDLYLIGFVLCGFLCPLSIAGAIKLKKGWFIKIAIFTGVGAIMFFYLLINVTPFG